ncbi:MAG: hypothetical protein AAGI72_07645 [Pseudomonadota bacterium]
MVEAQCCRVMETREQIEAAQDRSLKRSLVEMDGPFLFVWHDREWLGVADERCREVPRGDRHTGFLRYGIEAEELGNTIEGEVQTGHEIAQAACQGRIFGIEEAAEGWNALSQLALKERDLAVFEPEKAGKIPR